MSFTAVQSAMVKGFIDGGFFPSDKIAQPNVSFSPPQSEPWAEFFFIPNNPTVATLGTGGTDGVDGYLQVNLNFPLNKGTKPADEKFEAMRSFFTAGRVLTYTGGQQAVVASCGRSQGRMENGFWKVPVFIAFYARITR